MLRASKRVRMRVAVVGSFSLAFAITGCGESTAASHTEAPPAPTVPARRSIPTTTGPAYYVSPRGDDANAGSFRAPWRSIGFALSNLRPGETLYVRGGFYLERVKLDVTAGRPTAPIVVRPYGTERPLIVGQLWLGEASYWTISGINVAWSADDPDEPMLRMFGGTHWVYRDSIIVGAHSTSDLHIDDGPNDDLGSWAVVNNCIADTVPTNGPNQDHNVYVDDMGHSPDPSGLIAHNIIFGAPNGRGIKLGPGGTSGGPRNVVIRDNTIANDHMNISLSQGTSNIVITRNILLGARDASISGFQLSGTHNIAYDNVSIGAPRLLKNDGVPIASAHNHRARTIGLDSLTCAGFHPQSWTSYGARD
jgi:hypothetical protein